MKYLSILILWPLVFVLTGCGPDTSREATANPCGPPMDSCFQNDWPVGPWPDEDECVADHQMWFDDMYDCCGRCYRPGSIGQSVCDNAAEGAYDESITWCFLDE